MNITQYELIEFADEQGLKILGEKENILISKTRKLRRLIEKGLLPKPNREGGAQSYWENDTEVKDRIIWLDEQKKMGKSYRQMKEDLEPEKRYSPEELVVNDIILSANNLLKIDPDGSDDSKLICLKARMLRIIGRWEEALELLKSLEETCKDNKKLLIAVYDEIAFIYHQIEEKEEELAVCKRLICRAKELGDNEKLGHAYFLMGDCLCDSDIDKALDYYNRSVSLLKKSELLGLTYGGMYWAHERKGNFSEAEAYLKKSIKISVQIGDKHNECTGKANLGLLYFRLDRLSEALELMRETYHTMSQLHDLYGMATIGGNMGAVYMKKGLFSKAMEYFRHAYQLASQINNSPLKVVWLKKISEAYKEMGNSKKSEFYMKESKKIKENISDGEKGDKNQTVPISVEQNDKFDISADGD